MGDPKFRGMVFVEKNSIDIHEISINYDSLTQDAPVLTCLKHIRCYDFFKENLFVFSTEEKESILIYSCIMKYLDKYES